MSTFSINNKLMNISYRNESGESGIGRRRFGKKHEMTEEDIKLRYITPAIECKWKIHAQIRMEQSFTDGRVIVRRNPVARGKKKKTDYILYYKRNLPLAIVEAKR